MPVSSMGVVEVAHCTTKVLGATKLFKVSTASTKDPFCRFEELLNESMTDGERSAYLRSRLWTILDELNFTLRFMEQNLERLRSMASTCELRYFILTLQ